MSDPVHSLHDADATRRVGRGVDPFVVQAQLGVAEVGRHLARAAWDPKASVGCLVQHLNVLHPALFS